jgi:HEAT repeat protein
MLRPPIRIVLVPIVLLVLGVRSFADYKAKKLEAAEKAAREVLAQFEKAGPEWKVRVEGLTRLIKAGPDAVPVLVETLKDGSPPKRAFAAQVLAILAEPATGPALRKALEDPSPEVRIYALQGLSLLSRIDPAEQLYRNLLEKDPDRRVRYAVAWAIERDDAATAAAVVRKALSEYDLSKIDTARLDERAPDFSLTDAFGKTYRLGDFRGKKSVVLKFYHEPL